jgi:hypothetical protein
MIVTRWYKNGSLDAFRWFCIQNKDKPISVKLTNRSEPVVGALHNYCLASAKASGLFLLLTESVIHPAYYGLKALSTATGNVNAGGKNGKKQSVRGFKEDLAREASHR